MDVAVLFFDYQEEEAPFYYQVVAVVVWIVVVALEIEEEGGAFEVEAALPRHHRIHLHHHTWLLLEHGILHQHKLFPLLFLASWRLLMLLSCLHPCCAVEVLRADFDLNKRLRYIHTTISRSG